jgi:HK97 family phage major capsid protein
MITYLKNLTSERDSLTSSATELANKAAVEERDLTDTEQMSMRSWAERCATIDTQITEYSAQAESQRAYARLRAQLDQAPDDEPPARKSTALETRGWGDMFVDSAEFRAYSGAGTSQRVTLPGLFETRAEITSGGWTAANPAPYLYNPAQYSYASPLMSVVGHITTGSNAVEWVKWTPNPQAAASVVLEGAAKPEAAMTATPVSDTLDTYAHWKGITRQALEDIPQIRSIVENRLRQGIMVALETAVGAALVAATLPTATGAGDLLAAIRAGMGVVQAAGYSQPNAVLLNPADFAALDISVMRETNLGPQVGSGFWGMRAIAVPSLAVGTAYVGDFQAGVQIFDRGSTTVYLTDSHADYFVKNIVLLLAEIRALIAVTEVAAIAEVTAGTAPGATAARAAR